MKLPNLGAALDRAIARHVEAALNTEPAEDLAADSRAEVSTPKAAR
ncbi:hypothetical protein ACFS27_03185 [Promicromonospora vindobonensis]|uniref:Uncharacterized protein n=1 Tax=Promicromonospora vindobonensis TaxID=195748 RepID=A0ABW5VMW0_9MICO